MATPDKGGAYLMVRLSRLDEALLEAIDFGLAVPGEIVRETIYERLETVYGIKREEILRNFQSSIKLYGNWFARSQMSWRELSPRTSTVASARASSTTKTGH